MTAVTSAKEQFDRQAAHYNNQWAGWSDETLQRMLALADPQPSWRVLDVATGTGFTALAFALLVAEVTGADLSPGMLAQAANRATEQGITNVSWVEAPAENMPFRDATFDLVTVRIAPHHFTDVPVFLSETRRVLKPGGMFLLGDTTVPGEDADGGLEAGAWQNAVEKARDASHVANLSPKVWNELCVSAGFSVTHLEYSGKAIRIPLEKWLETAGCSDDCAARVRALFADAPQSARQHFGIHTDASGETYFGWARVLLRAVLSAER